MQQRPYLTPELDHRYQLSATRDGCLGLWGQPVFRGQSAGYIMDFKHIYYPIAQGDGADAVEIRVTLPVQCIGLMREINRGYVYTWLNALSPSRAELTQHEHNFLEFWKIENYHLSLIVAWYRQAADWSVIPDCVTRLVAVADLIKANA